VRPLLIAALLLGTWALAAGAQTPDPEPSPTPTIDSGPTEEYIPPSDTAPPQPLEAPPAFEPYWLIGPVFKQDGFGYDPIAQRGVGGFPWMGLQSFYRMEPFWGTGASLLTSPVDNAFEVLIEGRAMLPLGILDPYLGLQLAYLTRDVGGFSLALRPGLQVQVLPWVYLDLFGQLRFDAWDALFSGSDGDQLLFGVGTSLMLRI
jgi:hypothetical protein